MDQRDRAAVGVVGVETGLPDGGFLVTWNSVGQDGGGTAVIGQRYDAGGVVRRKIEFPITLKAGANTMELRITGKNDASQGFMAGLDCYRISRM